jgi:hypothetical protein
MKSMLRKITRLFVIKTRVEAYLIIFALAVGAMERGKGYLAEYPGTGGWLLFWACSGSVLLAGAKILDALRYERERSAQVKSI